MFRPLLCSVILFSPGVISPVIAADDPPKNAAPDTAAPASTPAAPAPDKPAAPAYQWSAAAKEVLEASKNNDYKKAFVLAGKAAAASDADCIFLAGRMHENGLGTEKDLSKAADSYRLASERGHLEAKTNWARCLEFGVGVKADPEKADFVWQQAAEEGFPTAQSRMGVMELEGLRRPRNETAAKDWLEKAAANNEPEALYRLALGYQHGWGGLPKDVNKAVEHVLKAANAGHLDAINLVGMYYQNGFGMRQDKVAAAGWFNFAADFEHPAALANLGQCYENGQGVKTNPDTAAKLYAAAAKKNDPAGCFYLARCFLDGRGTAKNLVFAYVNFTRAATLGLSAAAKQRDEVKARLTAKELTEAEKLLKNVSAGTTLK